MASESEAISSTGDAGRYSGVAVALHWLLAVALTFQVGLAWYMGDLEDKAAARAIEGLHISIGLSILILVVFRIGWFLFRKPPAAEPAAPWERILAHGVHKLLYLLMLAIPLSGWFMESLGKPIEFWGMGWPHLPVAGLLEGQDTRAIKKVVESWHGSPLVWTMIGLVALHVLGAIKHQFDGRPVLWRMIPMLRHPR